VTETYVVCIITDWTFLRLIVLIKLTLSSFFTFLYRVYSPNTDVQKNWRPIAI